MSALIDQVGDIAQRMKEIQADKDEARAGAPQEQKAEEAYDVQAPYGYAGMCGLQALKTNPETLRILYQAAANNMKSLAHPNWPYIGTPHEWRGFVQGAGNGGGTFNLPDVRGRVKASG